MKTVNDKHILYGGPIPAEHKILNKSLGEYLLEKLKSLGDTVLFVSIYVTLCAFSQISRQSYHFRHQHDQVIEGVTKKKNTT